MPWIDGHLDLAYLVVCGRDIRSVTRESWQPTSHAAQRTVPSGCVDLPGLRDGGVELCFATIFTEPGEVAFARGYGYRDASDHVAAEAAGLRQLEVYRQLARSSHIRIVRDLSAAGKPESAGCCEDYAADASPPMDIVLLMEGADPIRSPDHLGMWFEAGVRIIGLTWAMGTRYGGGNARPGPLTNLGVEMVAAMDGLGLIHDISHLADQTVNQLFDLARGPVIASHSNCRALIDGRNQRHLCDEHIREIGRRDGVIGLNLYSAFLTASKRRATIDDCMRHIDHVCEVIGHRRSIALGSDMDGGFASDRLPVNLDHPSKLGALANTLRDRGWSQGDIDGFAQGNWRRLLARAAAAGNVT